MDGQKRIKYIRILNKMNEYPEVSRKLGLEDRSYLKKGIRTLQKGEQA